ncbi:PREDICTED: uncharacterized protein LOC104707195 [Camelina sativa]|uniref:Uncharacterized protein LOC104707195 n=1 Tax=Camelina sativa TaxID=90675 RepID=A0ABM1QB88_CAMSA|nr:PREDICTED: uncharacterized protein LOC104707195 [Camelina sativa]XP_019084026.1 PREDICTED: uncharacterized protein LOC104707195 [Camelina sativa]
MDGNAFLFRIPNVLTINRVINQRLWNFEGQTMFVAKWEPGVVPVKPELSSVPIWLELRDEPRGDPKLLHPDPVKKTNLEVAKVFTIIDLRKPLPEAVNVKFQCGEIRRVRVSSPWMPPICSHCKEMGHTIKKCTKVSLFCSGCDSSSHSTQNCPRISKKKKQPQYRLKPAFQSQPSVVIPTGSQLAPAQALGKVTQVKSSGMLSVPASNLLVGESSGTKGNDVFSGVSAAEPDSSDAYSSDYVSSDGGGYVDEDYGFTAVVSKKHRRRERGTGLKINSDLCV